MSCPVKGVGITHCAFDMYTQLQDADSDSKIKRGGKSSEAKTFIVRLYQVLCEYSVAGRPLTPGSSTCGTKIAGSERGKRRSGNGYCNDAEVASLRYLRDSIKEKLASAAEKYR